MAKAKINALSDDKRLVALGGVIARWFAAGHRDLPWRKTRDPYAVWVSEIMLQQTRVSVVSPRFVRWMARFPTVTALAGAELDEVLAEWAGLGYYARARNLHAAARMVTEEYGGRVPDEPDEIARLPGIGRYTAGAILSIAHEKRVPILDGNVERVLSRVFRVAGDPKAGAVRERLWRLATGIVAGPAGALNGALNNSLAVGLNQPSKDFRHNPSHINQGLMELGAVVCSPRRPACLVCPATELCGARGVGDAEEFPGASKKQKVTAVEMVSVALVKKGRVLLMRRPPEGLWGGLFELPSGEILTGETPMAAARRVARERAGLDVGEALPFLAPDDCFVQELSHLRITFHAFHGKTEAGRVRRQGYDAHEWLDYSRARLAGIARSTHRLLTALAVGERPVTLNSFNEKGSGKS